MWTNVDTSGIPTLHERVRARKAIREMHVELELALDLLPATEERVAWLIRMTEKLKVWVVPIRILPFEILSDIFVMAAQQNWKGPARIMRVCRFWRDVVLGTPRAWSFIDLRHAPGYKVVSTFFQRSLPCLLHVYIPPADGKAKDYEDLVSEISSRIECMVITEIRREILRPAYPNLKRLLTARPLTPIPLHYIDTFRFPHLKFLEASFSLDGIQSLVVVASQLPLVEALIVTTDAELAWLTVVSGLASTLTALHIIVGHPGEVLGHPRIALPKLQQLEISRHANGRNSWFFSAKTPLLRTLNTIHGDGTHWVDVDVGRVTHLQCGEAISLAPYERLRELQIISPKYDPKPTHALLHQIRSDNHTCASLERIATASYIRLDPKAVNLSLARRNASNGSDLKILPVQYNGRSWPGDIRLSCGPSMPCNI